MYIIVKRMVIHLFGDRLKELRTSKNLSQEELSEILDVRKSSISNWETSKATPTFDMLIKIANYFGVTTDFLLGYNINNLKTIDKVNQTLREANLIDDNENLKEEEIKLALEQARQYKQMWKHINDLPNKYPEINSQNETKDTN